MTLSRINGYLIVHHDIGYVPHQLSDTGSWRVVGCFTTKAFQCRVSTFPSMQRLPLQNLKQFIYIKYTVLSVLWSLLVVDEKMDTKYFYFVFWWSSLNHTNSIFFLRYTELISGPNHFQYFGLLLLHI